jgi:hypothetical protein
MRCCIDAGAVFGESSARSSECNEAGEGPDVGNPAPLRAAFFFHVNEFASASFEFTISGG